MATDDDDKTFEGLHSFGKRYASEAEEAKRRLISEGRASEDRDVIKEMKQNRRINRTANYGGPVGGGGAGSAQFSFATGRPRDPMFYWRENNLPYDIAKDEELKKIRAFCRLLYITHPVISSAIDIFSKYPILDLEFACKDERLTDFYSDLFLDQLDYEEFLIDVGREYWTTGEAWPLGSFNETLGIWEADELINPDDVKVIRSPFLKEPRFEMALPEHIRKIVTERDPKWEYEALMRAWPELARFTQEDAKMPVSNIKLKQLRFKGDTFHPRGIPILMRGFRAIIQEEMLNAAQDAIAERLYTPLLIAKLGASATDLGTSVPWVPTQDDLAAFEDALDAALAGDFRVLITHFATDMSAVYGKEVMPDFNPDFDRLTDRQLQVFGLSKTMLSGAGEGETYAADALNRDLTTQLLTTYQRKIKKLITDRMRVVAEAQEHYDYEERNGIKYPVMEEILESDPETGEDYIIEQPSLLVPEVRFRTMDMSDETAEQQFKESLRESGVPISIRTRLMNVPIDLDDEIDVSKGEQVQMAVAAQETRKETYLALRSAGLPIDPTLRADFEPKAQEKGQGNPHNPENRDDPEEQEPQVLPSIGLDQPADTSALAPTPEAIEQSQGEGADPTVLPMPMGLPTGQTTTPSGPPRNRWKQRSRPVESDEMRSGMPKASSLSEAPFESPYADDTLLIPHPKHIGMRRFRQLDPNLPLDEQLERPAWD